MLLIYIYVDLSKERKSLSGVQEILHTMVLRRSERYGKKKKCDISEPPKKMEYLNLGCISINWYLNSKDSKSNKTILESGKQFHYPDRKNEIKSCSVNLTCCLNK